MLAFQFRAAILCYCICLIVHNAQRVSNIVVQMSYVKLQIAHAAVYGGVITSDRFDIRDMLNLLIGLKKVVCQLLVLNRLNIDLVAFKIISGIRIQMEIFVTGQQP